MANKPDMPHSATYIYRDDRSLLCISSIPRNDQHRYVISEKYRVLHNQAANDNTRSVFKAGVLLLSFHILLLLPMVQLKLPVLISTIAAVQAVIVVSEQSESLLSSESASEAMDFKMAQIPGLDATKLFGHIMSDIQEFVDQILHPVLTITKAPVILPTVPLPIINFPPSSVSSSSARPTFTRPTFAMPTYTLPTQPPILYQAKEKRALFNLARDLAEPLYHEDEEINLYFAVDDEEVASVSSASPEVNSVQSAQASDVSQFE
ncbi:hypothetical protein EDC96DRAFT_563471 [Choanephora cucurbitarum]|nr:hypothetical protein EDC96DRAFT_563471 [Choanephora cucurbitarum]